MLQARPGFFSFEPLLPSKYYPDSSERRGKDYGKYCDGKDDLPSLDAGLKGHGTYRSLDGGLRDI